MSTTARCRTARSLAIVLQARGSNNVSSLQTDAQKLDNATHVGGIAGRNNGTISASYVATDANGKSIIAARYGFVGGVAGSNSGSITNSGSQQAQALVSKVNNEWLPRTPTTPTQASTPWWPN